MASSLVKILSQPRFSSSKDLRRLDETESSGVNADGSYDYETAFELTGHGLFNYLALAACSLIFVHSSLEMAAIGYIITPAECDLHLSVVQKSMINSGIFIGILFTAPIWGWVSDMFGRRSIMLPALIGSVVTSFCSSLISSFWPMMILRILTGCLVSASSATVLVYLGEVQTHKYVDWSITFTMTATQITFAVLPLTAWAIIPGTWSFKMGSIHIKPWRVFIWLWGLVGLSGAIILALLPESPRFILAKKGPAAALPILARMYALNFGKKKQEFPVTSVRYNVVAAGDSGGLKSTLNTLMELLRPPIRRCFLISHFAMVFIFILSFGFYIWLPDFINDVASDMTLKESICDLINRKYINFKHDHEKKPQALYLPHHDHAILGCSESDVNTNTYPMAVGMEVLYLIPFLIIILIIDKFDKKKIYGVVIILCVIGLILCIFVPQILAALVFLIIGINCVIGSTLLSALVVEYFPTSLRSFAMCTMYMMGHIGAILGNNLVGVMSGVICHITFVIIALAILSSAFLLWRFWPKLHDVRQEMENRNFAY